MTEFSASSAAEYFGSMAAEYDSLIRRAVPRYEEMSQQLLDYLPPAAQEILELGCGTGNLSLRLARKYPDARLTSVDASPEMVELTRARMTREFPEFAARARFMVGRFEELQLGQGIYDLVVSTISLHHVADKRDLYWRLRRALEAGGTFRFADQMAGASSFNHALNWERWLAYCRQPGGCTEEEIAGLLEHASRHDHYVSVPSQLALLSDAGFVGCDVVWRAGMWGILTANC